MSSAISSSFPLYVGVNAIGRRNKDTATDIPIITSDPSMDRHHAIIKVTEGRTGKAPLRCGR